MLYIPMILLLEFSAYIALGFYKISVGCRGITVDCYIQEAEWAKDVQAALIILILSTLVWCACIAMVFAWRCFACRAKEEK